MKFLPILLALIVSVNAFAALKGAPFLPEIDSRFDTLENDTGLNTANVAIARKYAKAVYDVGAQGGASVPHALNVVLPAGAVIQAIQIYINTKFTQGTFGSVALQCAGTNDLMDWQDLSTIGQDFMMKRSFPGANFGTNGSIIPTGQAWTHVDSGASIPTACTVTAIVRSLPIGGGQINGGSAQTAGKFTAIIDYFNR